MIAGMKVSGNDDEADSGADGGEAADHRIRRTKLLRMPIQTDRRTV